MRIRHPIRVCATPETHRRSARVVRYAAVSPPTAAASQLRRAFNDHETRSDHQPRPSLSAAASRHRSRRLLLGGRGAHRSMAPALRGRPRLAGRGRARQAEDALFARDASACSARWRRSRRSSPIPGPRLLAPIEQALAERNAGVCVRLVQHVSTALLTGSYRHDAAAWDPLQEDAAARRRAAAAGPAGRQRPQAVLRDARRHAGRPVAVGARAARPEAAAAHRRRVHVRGRAGRHVRGRGHRHDLQPQPAGGGHPRRLRIPLTSRRAGAARVPAAASRAAARRAPRPARWPRRWPAPSSAIAPSWTSTC